LAISRDLKLGIIGMSPGNGHPYSWSAIFNGYEDQFMKDCPFEVIPQYLSQQNFPADSIPNAHVTHVWTQDIKVSNHIAASSKIPHVVKSMRDLIGQVDAILLARDDTENHYDMSKSFLESGIPIFIDKPIATSVQEATEMFNRQIYDGQLFTCSSLRYAKEFVLTEQNYQEIGKIKFIEAIVPKSWDRYAVHIIEPVLNILKNESGISTVVNTGVDDINLVTVRWEDDVCALFKVLGDTRCPLSIELYGTKGFKRLIFKDTFYAFKSSLEQFVSGVREKKSMIPSNETLQVVEIIEKGFLQKNNIA